MGLDFLAKLVLGYMRQHPHDHIELEHLAAALDVDMAVIMQAAADLEEGRYIDVDRRRRETWYRLTEAGISEWPQW